LRGRGNLKDRNNDTNSWPFVSIIIVNLNGRKWLEKCLKSILGTDYPREKFEIVLVDNGSTDGSVGFAERLSTTLNRPQIKIKRNKRNAGWSPANNQGMEMAKGDVLVCLSNDMEVDPRWLKELALTIAKIPRIGIVQCNSFSMWDRRTSDSAMNYLDKLGYAYGYIPAKEPTEVFFAEGMAFAFTRKVIEEIGMLDDYYFMEYDDMDFSWRARLAGYRVFFAPSARVYHARGGTVGATYFDRLPNITWYVRNHYVTLIKNYQLRNLLKVLPLSISIEAAKTVYFLLNGNAKTAIATIKGLLQALRDFKIILKKRKETQQVRKVPDTEVMKLMHPFNLRFLISFIASQSAGKRFISNIKPPVEAI